MPMRRKYKGKRRYKKAPSFKVLRLLEGLAQGKTQKQAALDAGFSSKNPSQSAYQALAVIREHMPELMDRCGLTAGALIEKYLLPLTPRRSKCSRTEER